MVTASIAVCGFAREFTATVLEATDGVVGIGHVGELNGKEGRPPCHTERLHLILCWLLMIRECTKEEKNAEICSVAVRRDGRAWQNGLHGSEPAPCTLHTRQVSAWVGRMRERARLIIFFRTEVVRILQ